ncbi:MAG: DHH family phosphoesterase [Patescibacteria group bacterium]|nr:DHH family phosphoesterase [Patescibacteria group bacterium]
MKTNKEELLNQLGKAKYPVIILPDTADNEIACAGLGLYNTLKSQKKEVSLVSYKKLGPKLTFLEGFREINEEIKNARNFILSFDTSRNNIQDVQYEKTGDQLNIYITPETGSIDPKDFSFAPGQFKYDLVIILGVAELQSVGTCYEKNADLFFDLPIINIDYHISNEQYGQVNVVDVKSSGVAELISKLFTEANLELPETAANCFYTGILEATESFQSPQTTPRTLTTAASLIDNGADHKEIVRKLYKTQDIDSIKLWGRLMSRIKSDATLNLAWTTARAEDFQNTKITTTKIRSIFDKIRSSYNKAGILMLLWETKAGLTKGLIQNSNQELFRELFKGIQWGNAVIFEINKSLPKAEKQVLKILEESIEKE